MRTSTSIIVDRGVGLRPSLAQLEVGGADFVHLGGGGEEQEQQQAGAEGEEGGAQELLIAVPPPASPGLAPAADAR